MATKSKRIKDKLLWEAYTPVEADADGYSDGIDFAAVVGNKRFHSFQVWRENKSGKPTYVYGLTLKQIETISKVADASLIKENFDLQEKLESSEKLITALQNRITSTATEHSQSELTKENNKLRDEKRQLEHELKKYLDRQSNNFTPRSHNSIRAISIPMGGSPKHRIKPKRR
jgi:hypothetical protein